MGNGLTVPSFSSIIRATPVDPNPNPGLGYYAGEGIAQQLLTASSSIQSNKQQKAAILGFADAIEGQSPELANSYRSIAGSMADFDPSVMNLKWQDGQLTGGSQSRAKGAGSGGGISMSGATGEVMGSMLDMLKLQQQTSSKLAEQNNSLRVNSIMENLRHANDMAEIGATYEGQLKVAQERSSGDITVEQLKAAREQAKSPIEAAKIDAMLKQAESNKAVAESQMKGREASASGQVDAAKIQQQTQVLKSTIDLAKQKEITARQQAENGAAAAGLKAPKTDAEYEAIGLRDPAIASQIAQAKKLMADKYQKDKGVKMWTDIKAYIQQSLSGGSKKPTSSYFISN